MELALSLEKLNFTKLRELWRIATEAADGQLTDFVGVPLAFIDLLHVLVEHLSSAPQHWAFSCSARRKDDWADLLASACAPH